MKRYIISRRSVLGGALATAISMGNAVSAKATVSDDGLYYEPWFVQSFFDLRDDFNNAGQAGKGFIVLWGLKGCPACKLLHTVNFAQPEISTFARENFDIVQINFIGSQPVTDFDGEIMPEKEFAIKHRIEGTPALQFFAPTSSGVPKEVARTHYLKPREFLEMLRFVRAKAYETMAFTD